MVGLALFLVGLFALATHNLKIALDTLEERVEIVVYLRDNANIDEIRDMRTTLSDLPEVLAVQFVTKDEALKKASQELPEFREVMTNLDLNPLPASLEIQLQPGSRTEATVDQIVKQAKTYPFVEEVQYGQEWVQKLFTIRRMGVVTIIILGSAFALAATLIIGITSRITVLARMEEIKAMQIVGAEESFIRRPLLIEGGMTGAFGGVIAIGLTYATFKAVSQYLFSIVWIPPVWSVVGILAGILFGFTSTYFAVRKHLKYS